MTHRESKHSKTDTALYNEIENRNMVARIAQLHIGHCGLNRHLHRFGKKDSSYCQCGYEKETVEHFLLECCNYKDQRKSLRKEVSIVNI